MPSLWTAANDGRSTSVSGTSATEENVGLMVTGMFRITGSVAVMSGSERKISDANK